MSAEQKLKELNIELPLAATPLENYLEVTITGNLLFVAGHLSQKNDGSWIAGKLGSDLTVAEGYEGAQLATLRAVASIKKAIGDLDRITKIVRLFCMVNSAPSFTEQHKVANGASDIIVKIFGELGRHARAAVGMASLPFNACFEVEMVAEFTGISPKNIR